MCLGLGSDTLSLHDLLLHGHKTTASSSLSLPLALLSLLLLTFYTFSQYYLQGYICVLAEYVAGCTPDSTHGCMSLTISDDWPQLRVDG